MDVTFLSASLPLTKTFVDSEGSITTAPYPHVSRLTSFHERPETLDQFAHALRNHAQLGHCLFNGQLTRPLTSESRAQKTAKNIPRDWLVFDFDKVELGKNESVVERYLPSYCHQVSYIEQLSASMFLPDTEAWSGHIFMLLKDGVLSADIVKYFEHLNFAVATLTEQLVLSKAKLSLHWPLDRSAGHDSKLIYIAPPRCVGFDPAIVAKDAIRVVKKKIPSLKLPTFAAVEKRDIDRRINDLRHQEGLDELKLDTRRFGDIEVYVTTPSGTIDSVKAIGEHYLKLNINGGDSWAYWLDLRNPELIHNFKSEPSILTKDLDEKFYKSLKAVAPQIISRPPLEEGAEVLAFYARNQGSQVKIGTFLPVSRRVRLDTATESSANAWYWSWGIPKKGPLDLFDIVFDPTYTEQYIPGLRTINTYRQTDYMLQSKSQSYPSNAVEIPRVIKALLHSVLGDPSKAELNHFLNWLAYIFQTRKKTGTAWVVHGTKGTGKGKLFEHVLRPLLGDDVCTIGQLNLIDTSFNSFIDGKLLVFIDEASQKSTENRAGVMSKLQHWITEAKIMVHQKGKDAVEKPNYANFIFAANENDPVEIQNDDRRFNVAKRQEQRFYFSPNDYLILTSGEELPVFADVLLRWPVDEAAVRTLLNNEARDLIHESTTNIGSLIAENLRKGNLAFFIDRMPTDIEAMYDFKNGVSPLSLYKAFIDSAIAGSKDVVTYDDLYIVFRLLIPDTRYFQDGKTWRLRYFRSLNLDTSKSVYSQVLKATTRGIYVDWKLPDGVSVCKSENVTSIKKPRKQLPI